MKNEIEGLSCVCACSVRQWRLLLLAVRCTTVLRSVFRYAVVGDRHLDVYRELFVAAAGGSCVTCSWVGGIICFLTTGVYATSTPRAVQDNSSTRLVYAPYALFNNMPGNQPTKNKKIEPVGLSTEPPSDDPYYSRSIRWTYSIEANTTEYIYILRICNPAGGGGGGDAPTCYCHVAPKTRQKKLLRVRQQSNYRSNASLEAVRSPSSSFRTVAPNATSSLSLEHSQSARSRPLKNVPSSIFTCAGRRRAAGCARRVSSPWNPKSSAPLTFSSSANSGVCSYSGERILCQSAFPITAPRISSKKSRRLPSRD